MCVAAFAWQAHPDWLLVAIGNRDEFHDRPAAALARWKDDSGILAGQDLKSGGTWMGVSERGHFALVTNRRGFGDPDPACASRGALVTDLLAGSGDYADPRTVSLRDFNPFNLIIAGPRKAGFLANRPDGIRTSLAHGIYGLSNGALDEPWPKTLQLKGALLDWLNAGKADPSALFAVLADEAIPDLGIHPRQPSDIAVEARDTAPFIRHPIYGTRCSTVVAISHVGAGLITERRFDRDGHGTGETSLDFRWSV